ncbi:MAG: hypothetical protein ACR2QH_04055 [Geminicoccaceae bacterium]
MGDHEVPFVVFGNTKSTGTIIASPEDHASKAADAIEIDLIDDVRDQFDLTSTDSVTLDPETFRRFLGDVPDLTAFWSDDLVLPQI